MNDHRIAINVYQCFMLAWVAAAAFGPLWKRKQSRPKHLALIFRVSLCASLAVGVIGSILCLLGEFRGTSHEVAEAMGGCGFLGAVIIEGFSKCLQATTGTISETVAD